MKTALEKLTELQNHVGYIKGDINPVALFGLMGECGEVLKEVRIVDEESYFGHNYFDGCRTSCVMHAKMMDDKKKEIRDIKEIRLAVSVSIKNEEDFDNELADQFYYLNAIAINRGLTIEQLAQKSYDKVIRKSQIDISTNTENEETFIP